MKNVEAIRARLARAIQEKVFPGCVIGLTCANKQVFIPAGTIDRNIAVTEDTIYDVASITKSIPVASLALTLIAEGKLSLADRVKTYLPGLQNDHDATIEDLLRYRVKGPQMSTLKFKTFEEIRTAIFERGFSGREKSGAYANVPAFLLGIIIERVTGNPPAGGLPALAHRYFFEPLGMNDTSFFPHDIERIAPTEIVGGIEIRGIVHDESARVFARARRAVGHAGLFSTASDLLKFLEALLISGFTKSRYSAIVEGAQRGLGWEVDPEWMAASAKASASQGTHAFGKTGFTGTSILLDIERQTGLVILSNRTYPHRPPDNSAINLFRKDIADIVLG